MAKKQIYRVTFINQGELYEIYANKLSQSSLFGFIEVEELVFNSKSQVVLDPSEEKLKNEFQNVKRSYIPMHSVVRIDEVDKQGTPKIKHLEAGSSNISQFPGAIYHPGKGDKK